MTTRELEGSPTFPVAVGTAISKYRICKYTAANGLEHAAAADRSVGIAETSMPAAAADRPRDGNVAVTPWTFEGRLRLIAGAAISIDAILETADDGEVVTFSAGRKIGYQALSAAAAQGDTVIAVPVKEA